MLFQQELTGAAVWVVPLLVFAAVLVLGLVARTFLLRALTRWSKRTTTRFDDHILTATRYPSYFWIFNLSVLAAMQTVDLPGDRIDLVLRRTLTALLILSVSFGVSRFLAEWVNQGRHDSTSDIKTTALLGTIVRGAVLAVGILIMLGTLGISIAPLLGALGIGGLAAGLALQPTLSNLFAGFQIAIGKQIRVGNRIRLASGEEGWVSDISWRTTTLRTPNNHMVLVPNSKFADSIVTNFSQPYPHSNLTLDIGVAYDSDPRRVEEVLRAEAARALAEIPELESAFEPVVRLQALGESALRFQVVMQVKQHDEQFTIWGELQQRFFACLQREGIVIPFPTREVYLRTDGAEKSAGLAAGQLSESGDPKPSEKQPRK
jgi:small-conductance mechanosensitive channel